jgi:hypothetical protein
VPAYEIRIKTQGAIMWMALAMMVKTRLWLAGEVIEPRDMRLIRRLVERVRRGAAYRPLLWSTDGLSSDVHARRATLHEPVHTGAHGRPRRRPRRPIDIAQVVKRDVQGRVIDVERRIGAGPLARVETHRRHSQGQGVINTAAIERLKATSRERLALLIRRGRALVRQTLRRRHGMYLSGSVSYGCTSHASLRLAASAAGRRAIQRTPARAAGITAHGWTIHELLSCQVPPPRGTPPTQRGGSSSALNRLIERWC